MTNRLIGLLFLVLLTGCWPCDSGHSQNLEPKPTEQPSPYTAQLYEMARAVEGEQLAKSPQLHEDEMTAFKSDTDSYSFEAKRWGDFLSVFIARGKDKYSGSINLSSVKEIKLTQGHPPDLGGSVSYNVIEVPDDPKSTNSFAYQCGAGNRDYSCRLNFKQPPSKGYHYKVEASLPTMKSARPMVYIPTPQITYTTTSSGSTGTTYNCGSGQVIYFGSSGSTTSYISGGNYNEVVTKNVARDAEDDTIQFDGISVLLYTPAGLGESVKDKILTAIAKGYQIPEGFLK
jgi:hypothetical protein